MWKDGAQSRSIVTKRPPAAGTLFKNSMQDLIKNLSTKEPFYVRCIKPNEIKSPNQFNNQRVSHQVAYLGLVENVRVRKAGFAIRQPYDRFLQVRGKIGFKSPQNTQFWMSSTGGGYKVQIVWKTFVTFWFKKGASIRSLIQKSWIFVRFFFEAKSGDFWRKIGNVLPRSG